uniref:Reticulon n=1 Tax=Sinocyclocheilus anshuiensis TaxID=1608454 RepID=A0A671NA61_9TELE
MDRHQSLLELLYWRDVRSSGLLFGCSLFLLLSLLSCSIISVLSYSTLALLSVTVSFRTYRGVLQAVQKSDEGHPFKQYLEKDVALSKDVVQRHSDAVLSRIDGVLKELRRLFLVEDLIDSLKTPLTFIVWTQNIDISQNIFFCASLKKESHTGLEQHEAPAVFCSNRSQTHLKQLIKVFRSS